MFYQIQIETDYQNKKKLFTEPPQTPINFYVIELSSRFVVFGWSVSQQPNEETVNGNESRQSDIIYHVQYKIAFDPIWLEGSKFNGSQRTGKVVNLKPATNYHFRITAENKYGESHPTEPIKVQTDIDMPESKIEVVLVEPISSQQLLVQWSTPEVDSWNGELTGYIIGYKFISDEISPSSSYPFISNNDDDTFNYTTVNIFNGQSFNGDDQTGKSDFIRSNIKNNMNSYRLMNLKKYSKYRVIVKAMNSKGFGPPSIPIISQTLEDVPDSPPKNIKCQPLTENSIQIQWTAPALDKQNGEIKGYIIYYETSPWNIEFYDIVTTYYYRPWQRQQQEKKIISNGNQYQTILHTLQPYTNYSIKILAFTSAGEGVISTPVKCLTHEAVPGPPEKIKAIHINSTSQLLSWLPPKNSNGLIIKYTIFLRILDQTTMSEIKIDEQDILITANVRHWLHNLNEKFIYEVWITASTRIGQGSSTNVIKLHNQNSGLIDRNYQVAKIISFGHQLYAAMKTNIWLACDAIGNPSPTITWKFEPYR